MSLIDTTIIHAVFRCGFDAVKQLSKFVAKSIESALEAIASIRQMPGETTFKSSLNPVWLQDLTGVMRRMDVLKSRAFSSCLH